MGVFFHKRLSHLRIVVEGLIGRVSLTLVGSQEQRIADAVCKGNPLLKVVVIAYAPGHDKEREEHQADKALQIQRRRRVFLER